MSIKISAAWEGKNKKGTDKVLYLSIPSSTREGEYLVGVSLLNDKIIIAHKCKGLQFNHTCKHLKIAYDAFLEYNWWKDLSALPVVKVNKEITLSADWRQIPIPGTKPVFV